MISTLTIAHEWGIFHHDQYGNGALVQEEARFSVRLHVRRCRDWWMRIPRRFQGPPAAHEVRDPRLLGLMILTSAYGASFPWTMRILAFMTLGLLAVTNLVRSRFRGILFALGL